MKEKFLEEKDFHRILWEYFKIHGRQRIKLLDFYIVLECFFIGGFFTISEIINNHTIYKVIIGLSMLFFSIVFRILDLRTRWMIKLVEDALLKVEKNYSETFGENYMIFSREAKLTGCLRKKNVYWTWASYSKSFFLIYLFFIIISIFILISSIFANKNLVPFLKV